MYHPLAFSAKSNNRIPSGKKAICYSIVRAKSSKRRCDPLASGLLFECGRGRVLGLGRYTIRWKCCTCLRGSAFGIMTTQVQLQFLNISKDHTTGTAAMPELVHLVHKIASFPSRIYRGNVFIMQGMPINNRRMGV